jgi:protease-4
MKILLRLSGLVLIASLAVLFSALTISFIQKEWFATGKSAGKDHVAVLDISGVIYSSSQFLKELDETLEKSNVKALVVRINSPGGLVAPSQEMYEALKKADQKIPVVISMSALAASGGYYASLGGREVFASPGTLTASIGVIMEYVNTQKLYEWAKIERGTIKAGKFKDIGSPLRPMKPEERAFLEELLKDTHDQFKAAVKERRRLTPEEIEKWCDGRVMTGHQAKEAKLIDTLGGFDDAVKEAKKLAKLPEKAPVDMPEKHKGMLREVLFGESESSLERLFESLVEKTPNMALSPGWNLLYLSSLR